MNSAMLSRRLLHLLSLAQLSLSVATQVPLRGEYLGYDSPYSFDVDKLDARRWMSELPDTRNLTSLSIPGTHDTMTSIYNGPISQCQNQHLATLLNAGIRMLDIRARLVNDELLIFHGISPTGYSYVDVLTTLFHFLDANPGEALIMRLMEEADALHSSIDFITAFNRYRLNDTRTAAGSALHLWMPPAGSGASFVPTLGALRGKVLILQNFGPEPAEFGIKWESPLLAIQDRFEVPDLHGGMDDKFAAIVDGLESAALGAVEDDGRLYLGHLSGSVYVLPIEVAAGTRSGKVKGMNDRTGEWLKERPGTATGVVIMDFPGRALVREILSRNGI